MMGNDGLWCWNEVIKELVGAGTSVWRRAVGEGVLGQKSEIKPAVTQFWVRRVK
jgi:hypothetical protein